VDARPDGYYGYVDWPSARVYGCSWIDKQRNHLYLYGGAIQSGSVNSDMWVFDLSQPSLGWKRVGPSNGQRVHQGRLSFSSNSKLVWPGVRVHPICWQQADPASGEELFFMMGGLTRASVTSSDSYQIFYSSDVFAFKPSSKTWAYVLGSYGDIDVDRANAQPSVGVMQRSALSWTSNSLRLYVHSNPIFNKDSVLDMLPLTLDPIAQAEWWDYDIRTHSFVRLSRRDTIENAQKAQATWSDAKNHYVVTGSYVSASDISSGLTLSIPLANFPSPTFEVKASDPMRNGAYTERTVAHPWIVATSVQSLLCGNRVYLFGSVNRQRIYGYIDQNTQRATFYPFATSGGASVPRPVTGAWVWRHPENGAYIMDGRLPYDHPQYGAELWRQSKDSSSADCFSLRP
jgi:hypothetical protein